MKLSKQSLVLQGGKGGGNSEGIKEDPNTLQANTKARFVDLISEGEIGGLVDGAKSIYLNDTPLQNQDDSFNFSGIVYTERLGLPDQPPIPGMEFAAQEVPVGTRVKKALPINRTVNGLDYDAVLVKIAVPALQTLDKKNQRITGTTVAFKIELFGSDSSLQFSRGYELSGKTTSQYERAYYIKLPGDDLYTVRVTRLTDDSTTQDLANDTYFSGYTQLNEDKFSYPFSALIGMEIDAQQFGSGMPSRTYLVRGIKCKVPSNYDPISHSYSGMWDGTWKLASTDDPAWILYDLLTNDRYGLGEVVTPESVDHWALYAISQYCNEPVPKPGGYEPRFTFNSWIANAAEAHEALSIISSAFRGMLYWKSGSITATQDSPEDPLVEVNETNVIDGIFTYQMTAKKARGTVVYVTWSDPNDLGKPAVELVEDYEGIARYGWQRRDITLPGCNSRSLAIRMGRWLLYTEQMETEAVQYQCYADHLKVRPGAIARITDSKRLGFRAGGRIKNVNSSTSLTLDEPYPFQAGNVYKLSLVTEDGSPEEIAINNPGVTTANVTLAVAPSQAQQPGWVWSILSDENIKSLYRVLAVREVTDTPGVITYEVSAAVHDPEKFDRVDLDLDYPDDPRGPNKPVNSVLPLTGLDVREVVEPNGQNVLRHLDVSWPKAVDPYASKYLIQHKFNEGGFEPLGETVDLYWRIPNVGIGIHTIRVSVVNSFGYRSRPFEAVINVGDVPYLGPNISGLEIENSPDGNEFIGRDAKFKWRKASTVNDFDLDDEPNGADSGSIDGMFKDYVVRIFTTEGQLLRTEYVTDPFYVYSFEKNYEDTGGKPNRRFVFSVQYRDKNNGVGRPSQIRAVNNPPPLIPVEFVPSFKDITAIYDPPDDPDFEGIIVWMSEFPGVAPGPDNRAFKGPGRPVFQAMPLTSYYFRYAFYDAFGETDILISAEQEVQTTDLTIQGKTPDEWFDDMLGDFELGTEIFEEVNELSDSIYASILSVEQKRAMMDRRTHIEGIPLGSFVLSEQERTDDLVYVRDIMGVLKEDRSAFILDMNKVLTDEDTTLLETFDGLYLQVGEDISAAISSEASIRQEGDELLLQRTDIMGAFDLVAGTMILDTDKVFYEPGKTLAHRFSEVSSEIDGAISVSREEIETWVDSESQGAKSLSYLGTFNNDDQSFTLNQDKVMWEEGESLAQRLSAIQAQIGSDIASYDSQIKAWVNSSSAGVQWINNLEASFGGNFRGQMVTQSSVVAGIGAEWSVSTTVTGNGTRAVGGLKLLNDGASSAFVMLVNTMGLIDPNDGNPFTVFVYDSGSIYFNAKIIARNIVANLIEAKHVKANNITESVTAVNNNSVTLLDGSEQVMASWSVNVPVNTNTGVAGPVVVRTMINISNAGGITTAMVRVVRDSAQIDSFAVFCDGAWGNNMENITTKDFPGAGGHTYSVRAYKLAQGGGPITKTRCNLDIEIRKTETGQ